jgi:hypothetical protein
MAFLDELDRSAVWADFMARMGPVERAGPMTKADFKAAVDAMDAYVANNAAAINAAFPTAARTALTNVEKIGVFAYVALKRYGKEVF